MRLPRWLIHLFDPAQRHLDAASSTRAPSSRARYREGAALGPPGPGGSRQATDAELAFLRSAAVESRRHFEEAVARVERQSGSVLRTRARELAQGGEVTVATTAGIIDGRIVRFSRGDSVLELIVRGDAHHPGFSRRTRLDRRRSQHLDTEVLAGYLIRAVAGLEPGAQVLDQP